MVVLEENTETRMKEGGANGQKDKSKERKMQGGEKYRQKKERT